MAKKPEKQPTPLEYAILGLAAAGPQTGYEICRLFEETPISAYSSSPGSIYPAIRRLRAAGLIADAPHPHNPQGSKKVLRITGEGVATLRIWLGAPVSREDVERFAFMSGNVSRAVMGRFLTRLKAEIDAHVTRLAAYAEAASPHMPPSGALALEAGIDAYRDRARWAARALDAINDLGAAEAPAKKRGAA